MEPNAASERAEPRSSAEVFADLRALAQSDGALHEISAIVYRDWLITVDTQEGRVADDPEHRWSMSRLNTNEVMLLPGLCVQSQSDRIYTVQATDDTFAVRADQLLREFHDRLLNDCLPALDYDSRTFTAGSDALGLVAREAIYYGAESFYLHQFLHFSRQRYREDSIWLLQSAGLSIRPMIDITKFIVDTINEQMNAVGHFRKAGREFTHGDLTNSLLLSKADMRNRFGEKADAFFARFTTPATMSNNAFNNPFAINAVAIAPIIDLGEHVYVPSQYRLAQTLYESPFYWMIVDRSYRDTAAKHRGSFLERSAAHVFRSVFGEENVYENVTIRDGTKNVAGEVDVLVVYGEFVLVTQAKSKRVTLKARAGDTDALNVDFDGAIQAPYQQALECATLISKGADCVTTEGAILTFPSLPRLFPVVILSDPFPASTFLSSKMLERGDNIAPVIWDLGVLDCVARLLPTPIEMIFYLKCRSEVFDKVRSDSEYNFLGYHIGAKLAVPDDVDMMILDRDFATVVDDYMISADVGVVAERPLGILERAKIPVISDLLAELKNADPRLASVVIDLYDFSSAALHDLSAHVTQLREEVHATGKAIKAFSIPTKSGGFTYAVTQRFDSNAASAAEAIAAKHKYDTKRDRWYAIVDSIETSNVIDGLLPLIWPWQHDEEEARRSDQVARLFNSRKEAANIGDEVSAGRAPKRPKMQ